MGGRLRASRQRATLLKEGVASPAFLAANPPSRIHQDTTGFKSRHPPCDVMRVLQTVAVFVLTAALAGCADEPAPTVDPVVLDPLPPVPQAVVALVDTGINPYHVNFRDESALAWQHPSTYIPGYPADAIALNLTLDAEDLDAALEADAKLWESVESGTLYWIPGTKIVGAYAESDSGSSIGTIFDTGHGTMTASRAAGNQYSLCPECRIAVVQGFTGTSVAWAGSQPWIDAQSNSWSPLVVFQQADAAQEQGLADAFATAATEQLVFGSAGNGVAGKGGVLGHPSFTRSTSGPIGVLSIGGHDNGQVILWSGSWPHVVADACANWAPVGASLDEFSDSAGGGTSSASPYAAGEAARLVLEAKRLMASTEPAMEPGIAAIGTPVPGAPLLEDGILTIDEVKTLLMKTAVARPVATEHDGADCGATGTPYTTYPIQWSDLPEDQPAYYFIGYGQVSVDSLATALAVLQGTAPMPERPVEDEWHGYAETLRQSYNDLPH
jgi:hypothetical protein